MLMLLENWLLSLILNHLVKSPHQLFCLWSPATAERKICSYAAKRRTTFLVFSFWRANVCGLPAADGERGEENGYEFRLAAELDEDARSSKGERLWASRHHLLHFILKKIILALDILELWQTARCMLNRCGSHSESKIRYVLRSDAPDYALKSFTHIQQQYRLLETFLKFWQANDF